jgi:predicted DNA-binding transcriptional regulator AlpA
VKLAIRQAIKEIREAIEDDRPVKVKPLAAASGRSFNSFYGAVKRGDVRSIRVGRSIRGLRRPEAALYVGVSPSKFDELVKDGRMPAPFHIDGCVLWDIRALDLAFDELAAQDDGANPWD